LIIERSMSLIGHGRVVLDGGRNYQVLRVNRGTVYVENVTISNGRHWEGAGVHNRGQLHMNRCTISDCRTIILIFDTNGGGVFNRGTLLMTNCTISNNRSEPLGSLCGGVQTGLGGGLFNHGGVMTLRRCTVTNNIAAIHSKCGSGVPAGGGIYQRAGDVFLDHTLVAGNFTEIGGDGPRAGPDFFGRLTSLGHNLIGDTTDCAFAALIPTDVLDVDADMDPAGLADHGGTTPTHAPLSTSPAVDGGSFDAVALPLDQRFGFRPIDGNSDDLAVQDIGAFEFGSFRPGDVDSDGAVTLAEFAILAACFGGPDGAVPSTCPPHHWSFGDVDGNGRSDLRDFAFLQLAFGE
jgi:hypothetical protein